MKSLFLFALFLLLTPLPARAAAPLEGAGCELGLEDVLGQSRYRKLRSDPDQQRFLREVFASLPDSVKGKFELLEINGKLVLRLSGAALRPVSFPQDLLHTAQLLPQDGAGVRLDPRSKLIQQLPSIDEATLYFASAAYDIQDSRVAVDPQLGAKIDLSAYSNVMSQYKVVQTYADAYSGFKGAVLEGAGHRIYAAAGSEVFEHRDFRDWATGLMLSRPQFVSDAALAMIEDAAEWTATGHGEVFFTGQSQGGILAQALGFLAQVRLNQLKAENGGRGFVHVVSWGAIGAREALTSMMHAAAHGRGRDFPPRLERHWALATESSRRAQALWRRLEPDFRAVADDAVDDYITYISGQMRVIGFFFEVDTFAHAGTFIGTPLMFPKELVIPTSCETMRLADVTGITDPKLGVTLESHFLNGYLRAVRRGGIAVARPARPERWSWLMRLQRVLSPLGRIWLNHQYYSRLEDSHENWERCVGSARWMTDESDSCTREDQYGCAPAQASWCLLTPPTDAPAGD